GRRSGGSTVDDGSCRGLEAAGSRVEIEPVEHCYSVLRHLQGSPPASTGLRQLSRLKPAFGAARLVPPGTGAGQQRARKSTWEDWQPLEFPVQGCLGGQRQPLLEDRGVHAAEVHRHFEVAVL